MTDALRSITLLTFDPVAGMAYLYFAAPGTGSAKTVAARVGTLPIFVNIDRDKAGELLGVEFPAASPEEALARAAEIRAALA